MVSLKSLAAVSALLLWTASGAAAQAPDAAALHARALTLDAHVDLLPPIAPRPASGTRDQGTQIDFSKLRAGGLDAVIASVFVEQGPRTPEGFSAAYAEALDDLAAIRAIAQARPREAVVALTADDVERAAREGKTALLIGLLNAHSLGRDPARLEEFHRGGVRVFGLVHAGNNEFADSSRPRSIDAPDEHGGLSPLGRRSIEIANRLGLLLDVSQLSTPAFLQAIAASRAPVIASHSGVRALVDSPRNLSDAELDALRANGGVIGVVAFNTYLRAPTPEQQAAVRAVRERYGATDGYGNLTYAQRQALGRESAALLPRASLDDFIDSIDYAVRRIGVDHVAISSDFNHGGGVEGWADAGESANVTAALLRRGYGEADIAKLWSGNVLRVLRAAQAAADAPNTH